MARSDRRDRSPVARTGVPTIDVTTVSTVWLLLLYGLSARQVVPPLGGVGTPAMLLAWGAAVWWLAGRLAPDLGGAPGPQPIRAAVLVHAWYMLATTVMVGLRPTTGLEQSGASREILALIGYSGIALLVADGISQRSRLRILLRRLVTAGAAISSLGIIQFVTGAALVLHLPGLTWNRLPTGVGERSMFNRPAATTLHPIELGVVLAALFPLAIHFVLHAEDDVERRNAMVKALLVGAGIPLTVSRSGLLVLVVGMVVLAAGWSWRRRAHAVAIALASVPLLWLAVPGLVGTLKGLVLNAADDPSVQARIDRIPRVLALVRDYPLFGRGNGTFSRDDYFLLDNEVYVTAIETGLVGVVVTLAFFAVAVVVALWVRTHDLATPEDASLGQALAAGIVGLVVSFATFDAYFYRVLTGTLFLLVGSAGALWRLTRSRGELVEVHEGWSRSGDPAPVMVGTAGSDCIRSRLEGGGTSGGRGNPVA